ncbi:hypothetical protein BMS83_01380 [Leuconostoc pseudomesenteroides]|nr:hypothetical protein BMS83_01380 [Leuconostoc pseudomesenteroides]
MTSLSSQERTVIQTLLELNYSVRAIARFIKRSPSTVSIEIHQVTPYKAEICMSLSKDELIRRMMWRMVYWVVIVLIVLVGCYLVYRSYKYSEIELVWWDYLLYIWKIVKLNRTLE